MDNNFSIVQVVSLDGTGDSCYRMEWPAQSLADKDKELIVINLEANHPDRYKIAEEVDLLVLFNCSDIDFLTVVQNRKSKGLKTLLELNDNYYEPQPWSPVAKEWSSWRIQQTYELFLQECDGIIVTGTGLKNLLKDKTKSPVFIIENHLPQPPANLDQLLAYKAGKSFGWAGSLGHIADILSVSEVVSSVLKQDSQHKFSVMGNESLSNILSLPKDQFCFSPWGTVKDYYRFWQPVKIGIIPLIDTPYNQCRSDIKIIEMISLGVLPIVPDLLPYQDLLEKYKLPTYHDHYSLEQSIVTALDYNIQEIRQIIEPVYNYITKERTEQVNFERYNLYKKFFPANKTKKTFSFASGYHHVSNNQKTKTELPFVTELKQIQATNNMGQADIALQNLQRLYQNSPYHIEYANALVNQTINLKLDCNVLLDECIVKYPNDIRFRLKKITVSSVENQISAWRELFIFIRSKPASYQSGVRENIQNALMKHLDITAESFNPAYLEISEEFLLMYPFCYQLRLLLAEKYEKLGIIKEARAHFAALLQAKRHFLQGTDQIQGLDYGYLSAWYEALDKRLKKQIR